MKRRVLVIGLDGATWDILNPLMRDGKMPHLKKLLDRSAAGRFNVLDSPRDCGGVDLFFHGQKSRQAWSGGLYLFPRHGYRVTIANSTDARSGDAWNLLSDRDLRVGVVSVPMTYPPEKVNGVMVTDMMTPNAKAQYTYPPELKQELLDKVGPFVITRAKAKIRASR